MPNIREENLAQHSYLVAVLAHAIGVIHNAEIAPSEGNPVDPAKLAVYGLYDDVAEIITGDPPTPVKYANDEIKSAYAALTQQASRTILATLPEPYQAIYKPLLERELNDLEQQLLKGADNLAALIHCTEERLLGNKGEFRAAYKQKFKRVMEGPAAVVSFANKYLKAFGKSLDELTHPDV